MTILVKGRKITIEDKLAELAKKCFIDLDERYCLQTIEAMLTPNLESLGTTNIEKEFLTRKEEDISDILKKGIIKNIKLRGNNYVE